MAAPKLPNVAAFGAGLRRFANDVQRQQGVALEAAALILVAQIKSELSTPGRGRPRKGKGARSRSNASAPGDPPAVDTGTLRNSIDFEKREGSVRVGTNTKYAVFLELGHSRMAPRPFMRPALEKVRAQLGSEITAVLRRTGGG